MQPDTKTLIFDFLRQVTKSKTITLNVAIVGLIVLFLKLKGIELTPEETQTAAEAITVILGALNVGLRFVTKKPVMEKKSLME